MEYNYLNKILFLICRYWSSDIRQTGGPQQNQDERKQGSHAATSFRGNRYSFRISAQFSSTLKCAKLNIFRCLYHDFDYSSVLWWLRIWGEFNVNIINKILTVAKKALKIVAIIQVLMGICALMGLFDGCFVTMMGVIAYDICGPSGWALCARPFTCVEQPAGSCASKRHCVSRSIAGLAKSWP